MIRKIVALFIIVGTMLILMGRNMEQNLKSLSPTLVLGFMLLSAYCIGFILERLGLPRITGYILAGLLMGPYVLKFFSTDDIHNLDFLNSLALAFIAFSAGGELRLKNIKEKFRSILFLIIGVTGFVFLGVTLAVFLLSDLIPFMNGMPSIIKLAISAIFGVIAVARSPSSAIAIISETKSKGYYTDLVLSVTIAMDVVIIIFFALIISVSNILISPDSTFSVLFLLELVFEIAIAFVLGFLLGKLIIFLIEKVKIEFPVVIIAMGFLVIKFSHLLSMQLHEVHDISINLEPLLICIAAGFTVMNVSKHGSTFLHRMDEISTPIYIGFFVITGASININELKDGWIIGIVIVVIRIIMIFAGSFLSGYFAGDKPKIYMNTWYGFMTQAGVSLGLLSEVGRRFPEYGVSIQTILIASITINQIIGPIGFKYALNKVGETEKERLKLKEKGIE